eukprot:14718086-Alexandrium_andersonii.AAC.1
MHTWMRAPLQSWPCPAVVVSGSNVGAHRCCVIAPRSRVGTQIAQIIRKMSTRGFQTKTPGRRPTQRIPKFEETGTQEARDAYSLNVLNRFHGALSQGHEAVAPPDSASSKRGEHQVAVSVAVGRE